MTGGEALASYQHPEAFQRLLVRTSIRCYPDFILDKGRSLGFASARHDWTPISDSLSLRLRASSRLTLPCRTTRRFNFTLLFEVLFTFPSRYWFAIGLSGVFSLAGWSRRIHAGFLVPRATQDTATLHQGSCTQLSCSMAALSRAFHSPDALRRRGPTTPAVP